MPRSRRAPAPRACPWPATAARRGPRRRGRRVRAPRAAARPGWGAPAARRVRERLQAVQVRAGSSFAGPRSLLEHLDFGGLGEIVAQAPLIRARSGLVAERTLGLGAEIERLGRR